MDHVFSPWRYTYVASRREGDGCVLCRIGAGEAVSDEESLVLARGEHHFVVLNRFPYNSGHLMIVPYLHAARLADLDPAVLAEMGRLAARAEGALVDAYRPDGVNLGMNLGKAAGAGIEDHLHLHVVPRWAGDTNFMTVAGETRVLPEGPGETWRKLRGRL